MTVTKPTTHVELAEKYFGARLRVSQLYEDRVYMVLAEMSEDIASQVRTKACDESASSPMRMLYAPNRQEMVRVTLVADNSIVCVYYGDVLVAEEEK